MKRTNVAVVVLTLIAGFIVIGSATKVNANPHADVSGFCVENDDFGMSHGECVSIGQANVNALAGRGVSDGVAICKMLEQVFGPFPLGKCITHF